MLNWRQTRVLALIALLLTGAAPARADAPLLVFAAASLKNALDEAASDWRAAGGAPIRLSFAGSSALARQIEAGAPADLFISANVAWMDALTDSGLVSPDDRIDLLRNNLVLITADKTVRPRTITPSLDLDAMIGDGRLAMAFVNAVPAGVYGKAALSALGLWDRISDRVVQTDNVRTALHLAAIGEAALAIVYASDVVAETRVRTIGQFPEDSHPPILYPAAVIAESRHSESRRLLTFLKGPIAAKAFTAHGFRLADPP